MAKEKRNGRAGVFSAQGLDASVVPTGVIPMDNAGAERLRRIAEAAYKRAEERGFAPGNDLDDWLAAEREVDAPNGSI